MNSPDPSASSALVAVLGDLGRSPRMLNHARMLLAHGWSVTLAGLRETELPADLASHRGLSVQAVDLPLEAKGFERMRARWRLLRAIAADDVGWSLAIVQNPPSFPLLAVLRHVRLRRRGLRLIVDWHNLGHTLLASAGRGYFRVAVYRWAERFFARRADRHWAVSAALAARVREWLGEKEVTVLRDQPPTGLIDAAAVHGDRAAWWRSRLPEIAPPPEHARWLVMPSSWTVDEKMELLLDAVDRVGRGKTPWPEEKHVTVIATGQGARRDAFVEAFCENPCVSLRVAWLPARGYAELLGHADAGLCLHASSSGLDLPLKLADMRGARLPALVLNFGEVLEEVFDSGVHGERFHTSQELAVLLATLARTPPERASGPSPTWEDVWRAVVPEITAAELTTPD